jgi:cardiolipin hydrolase
MDTDALDAMLARTLDDRALSRGERRALGAVLEDLGLDERGRAIVRARAFEAARAALDDDRAREVIGWLEEVIRLSLGGQGPSRGGVAEAYFSPGGGCLERIVGLFRSCATADVCVFTIADDRIARAIRDAHERGAAIRIVTDDEKADDPGSDVHALARAGIPVAVDRSPAHMHHKFAIFDRRTLVTGSYNWTRSASERNQENFAVLDDPRLVAAYAAEFERLFRRFA